MISNKEIVLNEKERKPNIKLIRSGRRKTIGFESGPNDIQTLVDSMEHEPQSK